MKIIKKIGVGLGLLALITGENNRWINTSYAKSIESFEKPSKNFQNSLRRTLKEGENRGYSKSSIEKRESIRQVVNFEEENESVIYKTIEDYLYEHYKGSKKHEGYVDFMSKHSGQVKKNIELNGKEKVIECYVEVQRKCLDLALTRAFGEIREDDINKLSSELVKHQKQNAKETYLDYNHSAIKEGYKSFGKEKAVFFKKIIETNTDRPQKDFCLLLKNTFTREEYAKEMEKQREARKNLYRGFAKSLENYKSWVPGLAFLVRLFAPGILKKSREKSDEYNLREIEMFYGNNSLGK